MDRKDNMPLWVFLGLLNLETRKAALFLVRCTLVFGLVFLPCLTYWMTGTGWTSLTGAE